MSGQHEDIFFEEGKVGVEWDGSTWYFDSDPERLFVNDDGDLEWADCKKGDLYIASIATQRLSKVGDVAEKSYMFMSDGDHDCEDCLKCPDSCFDDDITCLAGTSDLRFGLYEAVGKSPDDDDDNDRDYRGYNFRFGPNMMAGPWRWVDCTDEVHKTGMFAKTTTRSSTLQSKNSGLMGKIPGFDLEPGEYSFFNIRLERISLDSIRLSITLNDRTIRYTDDSGDDLPEKINVMAVSMRNGRPYSRVVLRAL
jgi:hypothetical protein